MKGLGFLGGGTKYEYTPRWRLNNHKQNKALLSMVPKYKMVLAWVRISFRG